jgi:hypothetical protein
MSNEWLKNVLIGFVIGVCLGPDGLMRAVKGFIEFLRWLL